MSPEAKKTRKVAKRTEPEEKPKTKGEPPAPKTALAPMVPVGSVPRAEVESRHGQGTMTRQGRGFSLGEVKRAGIGLQVAGMRRLPVDVRRRSVLERNVEALKKWSVPVTREPEPKPAVVEPAKVEKPAKEKRKKPAARKKK